MIELLAIIMLGKTISSVVREKGLKPIKYVLIMLVLWIGLEFIGAILGLIFLGGGLKSYPFALLGAILGGYLSYNIAKNAKPEVEY